MATRSTVRIDEDLMQELKAQAQREQVSVTRMLNRLLRVGIAASRTPKRTRSYREKTHSLGQPRIDLDKALSLAAELENEEVLRKVALRK